MHLWGFSQFLLLLAEEGDRLYLPPVFNVDGL
jgi:hypothetical protein